MTQRMGRGKPNDPGMSKTQRAHMTCDDGDATRRFASLPPRLRLTFLLFTVFVLSSSSSSSSSSTHVKSLLPSCDCPLGSSPNGGLTSCVFASSCITTWLKAQDHSRPLYVLMLYVSSCLLSRRRRRPVRLDAFLTPFLLLTDSTRPSSLSSSSLFVVVLVVLCSP